MIYMVIEILVYFFSVSGWVLVCSTLPADYWKVSSNDGTIISTISFWSNLWKTCTIDSTSVTSCNDFSSMLDLDGYLHISRSLLIAAVCLGFFGVMIALVGMKCTKIGGSDKTKSKIAFFAGLNFLVSGLCSLAGYSVYAHQVMSEFFYPSFRELKFELGSALFIGWSGSSLSIVGGLVF
ncbi:claudin-10-like, partial [Scleropages formosus]